MKRWVYKSFVIDSYSQIDSTNKRALELARDHQITHNHVICAEMQTAGRGRYSRSWHSPCGNLYFSLLLYPPRSLETCQLLSFVAVVALGEAIAEHNKTIKNIIISYKWPNDLLINDKKVAGILLESDSHNQNNNLIVLGMGVNLVSHPKVSNYPATDLCQQRLNINPEAMLTKFLDKFDYLYNKWLDFGFSPIRNLWLKKAFGLGSKLDVNLYEKKLSGIFRDLDQNGNLVLELDLGESVLISCGEVYKALS